MSAVAPKIGAVGAVLMALAACTVSGGGVAYDGGYAGVGYEGGFYEPYGYDYGGWGGRYHVGPPRGGPHDAGRPGGGEHPGGGGRPVGHPGGGGRSAPSIPGRPRGH